MSEDLQHFWDAYRRVLKRRGVPEKSIEWYVRWAQRYAVALKGKPLRRRSDQDAAAYLRSLQKQKSIQQWQVRQAKEALEILYADIFQRDLQIPHLETATAEEAPGRRRQPSRFLDGVSDRGGFDEKFGCLLEELRAEIRVRHYSIRTEHSYVSWVRRFFAFHKLQSVDDLGSGHIKEFLSYLARGRRVAASTQNQALNALVFLYAQVLEKSGRLRGFRSGKAGGEAAGGSFAERSAAAVCRALRCGAAHSRPAVRRWAAADGVHPFADQGCGF